MMSTYPFTIRVGGDDIAKFKHLSIALEVAMTMWGGVFVYEGERLSKATLRYELFNGVIKS